MYLNSKHKPAGNALEQKTERVINLTNFEDFYSISSRQGLFSAERVRYTRTCARYNLNEMDCSCLARLYGEKQCSSSLTYSMNNLTNSLSILVIKRSHFFLSVIIKYVINMQTPNSAKHFVKCNRLNNTKLKCSH